jgi:hypothetical protein
MSKMSKISKMIKMSKMSNDSILRKIRTFFGEFLWDAAFHVASQRHLL